MVPYFYSPNQSTLTQQQFVIVDPDIEDALLYLSVDQLQYGNRSKDEVEDVSSQPTTDHSDLQQLLKMFNGAL